MKNKLNLGCGNIIMDVKEWINHDLIKHRDEIEITCDLNPRYFRELLYRELKMSGSSFTEIRAWDVIEHLDDPISFMENCWWLLKDGGELHLKACGWQNPNFYVDITHKKAYDIKSFDYFDPTTEIGKEYGYYTKSKWKILEKDYDRNMNVIIKLKKIK